MHRSNVVVGLKPTGINPHFGADLWPLPRVRPWQKAQQCRRRMKTIQRTMTAPPTSPTRSVTSTHWILLVSCLHMLQNTLLTVQLSSWLLSHWRPLFLPSSIALYPPSTQWTGRRRKEGNQSLVTRWWQATLALALALPSTRMSPLRLQELGCRDPPFIKDIKSHQPPLLLAL